MTLLYLYLSYKQFSHKLPIETCYGNITCMSVLYLFLHFYFVLLKMLKFYSCICKVFCQVYD